MSKKLMPLGARVMVKDIEPVAELAERARSAGLELVMLEHNKPQPTTGVVVAVGSDPEIQSLIKVGDTVMFGRHCGIMTQIEGVEYRSLEFHEISSVLRDV